MWQARDRQRAMERNVRSSKQLLVAYDEAAKNVFTDEERMQWKALFNNESVKLKGYEAKLKDFCEQTGLHRDKFREQVFAVETENGIKGFGKSVSQKAVKANEKILTSKQYYDKVKAGTQPLEIQEGSQGKHIIGHNNYIPGRSYLTISLQEAQELVNKYSGKGKFEKTRAGLYTNKEKIKTNNFIGVNVNNMTGECEFTESFYIHYSKEGTHIVPTLKKDD